MTDQPRTGRCTLAERLLDEKARLLPVPIGEEQSSMIRVARVLCILFMMTTHAWPGSIRVLSAEVPPLLHGFYVIVIDMLGRAAVPLLSMISGLLFVHTFVRQPGPSIVLSKLQTLVVPMAVWSLPLIPIAYASAVLQGEQPPRMDSIVSWVNLIFGVTTSPANGPLHFLRDIFIMSLYGILILNVWRISQISGLLVAVVVVVLEQIPGGFLLFRNQIATMYVFGMLLAVLGGARWKPSWPFVLFLMVLFILDRNLNLLGTPEGNHVLSRVAEHLPRVAMSFLMWRVSFEVAARGGLVRDFCVRFEPHIFVIFCSHAIVFSLFGGVARFAGLREDQITHPLILIGQITLFFLVGTALSKLLRPFPWLRGRRHAG